MSTTRWAFAGLMIFTLILGLSGCNYRDVIQAKTPVGVQKSDGLPATMPLSEAEVQYRIWYNRITEEGAAWKASIDRADEIAGALSQLTLQTLEGFGPEISGVPVVGAAFGPLMGLAGIVLGRAGTRKEKEKSFNEGQKRGAKIAKGEYVD